MNLGGVGSCKFIPSQCIYLKTNTTFSRETHTFVSNVPSALATTSLRKLAESP